MFLGKSGKSWARMFELFIRTLLQEVNERENLRMMIKTLLKHINRTERVQSDLCWAWKLFTRLHSADRNFKESNRLKRAGLSSTGLTWFSKRDCGKRRVKWRILDWIHLVWYELVWSVAQEVFIGVTLVPRLGTKAFYFSKYATLQQAGK